MVKTSKTGIDPPPMNAEMIKGGAANSGPILSLLKRLVHLGLADLELAVSGGDGDDVPILEFA